MCSTFKWKWKFDVAELIWKYIIYPVKRLCVDSIEAWRQDSTLSPVSSAILSLLFHAFCVHSYRFVDWRKRHRSLFQLEMEKQPGIENPPSPIVPNPPSTVKATELLLSFIKNDGTLWSPTHYLVPLLAHHSIGSGGPGCVSIKSSVGYEIFFTRKSIYHWVYAASTLHNVTIRRNPIFPRRICENFAFFLIEPKALLLRFYYSTGEDVVFIAFDQNLFRKKVLRCNKAAVGTELVDFIILMKTLEAVITTYLSIIFFFFNEREAWARAHNAKLSFKQTTQASCNEKRLRRALNHETRHSSSAINKKKRWKWAIR